MPAPSATAPGWGRVRLLTSLVGILLAVVSLVGGLVALIADAVDDTATQEGHRNAGILVPAGTSVRDAIAAAAMLDVAPGDARRGAPSATSTAPILVPAPTAKGPGGVPAGFPPTPAGAIGQLAAIDTTVLTAMSLPDAATIRDAWTLPGAPQLQWWAPAVAVRSFRTASATTGPVAVAVEPVAAQVKGTDGPHWVLACVLYRIDAAVTIAYGRCERLQWQRGRWLIAPGAAPAAAPSTWPGTDLSHAAGWRPWRTVTREQP